VFRYALLGALAAGAVASAPALACTIDTCPYLQPVCNAHVVDCRDFVPLTGVDCVHVAGRGVCIPNPPPIR
jgi:hypothetical protein